VGSLHIAITCISSLPPELIDGAGVRWTSQESTLDAIPKVLDFLQQSLPAH
jgi:hypothetical protein